MRSGISMESRELAIMLTHELESVGTGLAGVVVTMMLSHCT